MAVKIVVFLISVLPLYFCWLLTNAHLVELATVPNGDVLKANNIDCDEDNCHWVYRTHCVNNTCVCHDGYEWNDYRGECTYSNDKMKKLSVVLSFCVFAVAVGIIIFLRN